MKQDLLKGLTDEQITRVKACKNSDEILKVAKEEGIVLTAEQLEAVSGGGICNSAPNKCPVCGSKNFSAHERRGARYYYECKCKDCGHEWNY